MSLMNSLHSFVQARHGRPLQAGVFDGAIFAADWIAEVTGEDPAAPFRGQYETFMEGLRLMRKAGYRSLAEIAAASCAPVAGGWMGAQTGDVALIDDGVIGCAGIVAGDHVIVVSPDGGLDFVAVSRAQEVYRPCVA